MLWRLGWLLVAAATGITLSSAAADCACQPAWVYHGAVYHGCDPLAAMADGRHFCESVGTSCNYELSGDGGDGAARPYHFCTPCPCAESSPCDGQDVNPQNDYPVCRTEPDLCDDACGYRNDGVCDDGGPQSAHSACALGNARPLLVPSSLVTRRTHRALLTRARHHT